MEGNSAAVVSGLDDLLLEILLRLPAKSLIKFKIVSKLWRSLISDTSFRHLHTRRRRKPQTSFLLRVPSCSFFYFNPTRKNFVPFHFNFNLGPFKILQSCNGLLLLQRGYPYEYYYVCNPTTGESRDLLVPKGDKLRCLFLAFDPLKSPHYKVVCLHSSRWPFPLHEIQVYNSETHKWRDENVISNMHQHLDEWVYSDSDKSIYALTCGNTLLCFDIEKLCFRTPCFEDFSPNIAQLVNTSRIMESFGHVHRISHDDASTNLVVSEMTLRNEEWSFKHLFDFDIKLCLEDLSLSNTREICFLGVIGGKRKENSLVFHIPGKIMAYRFYERRYEELLDLSTLSFYKKGLLQFGYSDSYQFVESLTPV